MNLVKAYAQRIQEQQQKQQGNGPRRTRPGRRRRRFRHQIITASQSGNTGKVTAKTAPAAGYFRATAEQARGEHRLELQRRAREIKLEETAKDIRPPLN